MERMGVCTKCGKKRLVRDHHIYGYDEEHKDEVVPYCRSCDWIAHDKARKCGKCKLTIKESQHASNNSYKHRSRKSKKISDAIMMPNIRLFEIIQTNINTGSINIQSYFCAVNGKKLKLIEENKKCNL